MGGRLLAVTSAWESEDGPTTGVVRRLNARFRTRRLELRIRLPTACAGSLAIWLAARGQVWPALSVLAIGLLAEVAAAAATAVHGAGEGLRDGLRQRLRRLAGGTRGDRNR